MKVFRRLWQVFNMKKNVFFLCFYAITFIVMLINGVYLVVENIFIDISDVPNGQYKSSSFSPDNKSELKVYIVETELGNAVRVSRSNNGKTENIFWQANEDNANIYWNDNNKVIINGIMLDFEKDETFDSRSMRSIFNDGLMGWGK